MSAPPPAPPPTPAKAGRRRRLALVALAAAVPSCAGGWYYATSAPPVARAVALVEHDPNVAEFLGSPVEVALATPRSLWRDPIKAARGDDTVTLVTSVHGPRGQARLSLEASRANGKGWFGSFSVVIEGEKIPQVSGCYMIEGARVIVKGLFMPDGAPVIKLAQSP